MKYSLAAIDQPPATTEALHLTVMFQVLHLQIIKAINPKHVTMPHFQRDVLMINDDVFDATELQLDSPLPLQIWHHQEKVNPVLLNTRQ